MSLPNPHCGESWDEVEPILRDRAYRRINAMPELLLETDVYPPADLDADLYYARLIGFEDEIVQDGLRVNGPVDRIRVPLPRVWRTRDVMADWNRTLGPMDFDLDIHTADYLLQSCWSTCAVSGFVIDVPVPELRDDYTAVVAFLRYRRRS